MIKKPRPVEVGHGMSVQIGRTVMQMSVEENVVPQLLAGRAHGLESNGHCEAPARHNMYIVISNLRREKLGSFATTKTR